MRIIVPRALSFVYTIRNKRGSIHVGEDVDTSNIDLIIMIETVNWIFCELIRLYGDLNIEIAKKIIAGLTIREMSDIWEDGEKKRVMRSDLGYREKTLYLAYKERPNGPSLARNLLKWSEYESGLPLFRKLILIPLHQEYLIHFDQKNDTVTISTLGEKEVEENIINYVA